MDYLLKALGMRLCNFWSFKVFEEMMLQSQNKWFSEMNFAFHSQGGSSVYWRMFGEADITYLLKNEQLLTSS